MNLSISSLLSNLLIKIVSSTPLESLALCQTVHLKCAKSLQSCLTLCNPMNCSLPGSSIHGILQARILEGLPCPPPGDLPNPGIKTHISYISCIGRRVLYHLEKETATPLQYSCLENSMDRGAWQATVHGVAKSQT